MKACYLAQITEHISSQSHQIMLSNKLFYGSSYKSMDDYDQEKVTPVTRSRRKILNSFRKVGFWF